MQSSTVGAEVSKVKTVMTGPSIIRWSPNRLVERFWLILLVSQTASFELISGLAAIAWGMSFLLFSHGSPRMFVLYSCVALVGGTGQLLGVLAGFLQLRGASATLQCGLWLVATLSLDQSCREEILLLAVWSMFSLWLVFRLSVRLYASGRRDGPFGS